LLRLVFLKHMILSNPQSSNSPHCRLRWKFSKASGQLDR
jgi:hypothetical protein